MADGVLEKRVWRVGNGIVFDRSRPSYRTLPLISCLTLSKSDIGVGESFAFACRF